MTDAVEAVGIKPFAPVSRAGHDAMAIKPLRPVAMLFILRQRGVSHNAEEAVASEDVGLAARALVEFVERLAMDSDKDAVRERA